MKTPREVLLHRHQEAVEKLDERIPEMLKQLHLSDDSAPGPSTTRMEKQNISTWGEFFRSLRWHAATATCIWIVCLVLSQADSSDGSPHQKNENVGFKGSVFSQLLKRK